MRRRRQDRARRFGAPRHKPRRESSDPTDAEILAGLREIARDALARTKVEDDAPEGAVEEDAMAGGDTKYEREGRELLKAHGSLVRTSGRSEIWRVAGEDVTCPGPDSQSDWREPLGRIKRALRAAEDAKPAPPTPAKGTPRTPPPSGPISIQLSAVPTAGPILAPPIPLPEGKPVPASLKGILRADASLRELQGILQDEVVERRKLESDWAEALEKAAAAEKALEDARAKERALEKSIAGLEASLAESRARADSLAGEVATLEKRPRGTVEERVLKDEIARLQAQLEAIGSFCPHCGKKRLS